MLPYSSLSRGSYVIDEGNLRHVAAKATAGGPFGPSNRSVCPVVESTATCATSRVQAGLLNNIVSRTSQRDPSLVGVHNRDVVRANTTSREHVTDVLTQVSKHVLNAQVSIRSPCCRQWFDCAQCHADTQTHNLKQTTEMIFACKKCKKCFRKDMAEFEDSDEYCPHCDNHFLIEAKEPKARLEVEGEDVRKDARMLKDERMKQKEGFRIWDDEGEAARLG